MVTKLNTLRLMLARILLHPEIESWKQDLARARVGARPTWWGTDADNYAAEYHSGAADTLADVLHEIGAVKS